jgi:hypothetical protein
MQLHPLNVACSVFTERCSATVAMLPVQHFVEAQNGCERVVVSSAAAQQLLSKSSEASPITLLPLAALQGTRAL